MKTITMAEYQTTMEEWTCAVITALNDLFEQEHFDLRKRDQLKERFAKVAGETSAKIVLAKINSNFVKEMGMKKI